MLDVFMVALGLGFFVAAVGYAYACERLCFWREPVSASPKRFGRTNMIFDYALAGLVSAGLLFYLTYALLRPERF